MAEQSDNAVLAVGRDGRSITEVAASWDGGLEALVDRSHRPASCPHHPGGNVQFAILAARRAHPG